MIVNLKLQLHCLEQSCRDCREVPSKITRIGLEGRHLPRTCDTKEGEKKYITEVVASRIMMLDPKPKAAHD